MGDSHAKAAEKAMLLSSVDEIEAAFYDAMQHADMERMMSLWSDDEDIACVHPGGLRLVGAAAIRSGFEALFANGPVHVNVVNVRRIETTTVSIHHVLEKVQALTADGMQTALLLASNVYVKGAQGWRLVLHHASPGHQDDSYDMAESAAMLH